MLQTSLIGNLRQVAQRGSTDMFKVVGSVSRIALAHVAGRLAVALSLSIGCISAMPAQNAAPPSSVHQELRTDTDSYVKISIREIADAQSRRAKIERAQELTRWVGRHPNDVSGTDVGALANLLSDPDDVVRGWIAAALGLLGHKAKSAVPQLRQALLERPCANQPATSASAIRLALSRIGAQPINAPCTNPFGTY